MIHHYTSIKSLALILKSKKLRFSRIDGLDDIKEIEGIPEKFKRSAFVSCWTDYNKEDISLWSLYTNMNGVRITLPQDMFNKYLILAGDYGNWGFTQDTNTPLPIDKIRTDEYIVLNPFWLEDGFYKKVIYTDLPYYKRKNCYDVDDSGNINIKSIQNLFIYKDSIWEFQKESRFYLIAVPLPPIKHFKDRETQMLEIRSLADDFDNNVTYIDVDINKNALDNITVRLGTACTYADRIIVESLISKYTSKGKIEDSNLMSSYRIKK